jgi:hypothetical protein
LGFLGESRNEKGFNELPKLLSNIYENNYDINFIVQISNNIYPNTIENRKKIIELSNKYNKIKILYGYLDFSGWRSALKQIDIMPILYEKYYRDNIASGLFYSCISHEIPMVIPKDSMAMKKFLKYSCYLESENFDNYIKDILYLKKNYNSFLIESKKQALHYKKIIENQDDLINAINK